PGDASVGDLDGDGTEDFPTGTYAAGTIYNADIMFDSSKNLSVSGEDFTNDIRMIALHEIGHLIGLSHSSIEKASLWPFAHGNVAEGRTLAEDDIAYASLFYPQLPQYTQAYGTISGQVSDGIYKNGVLGAHVFAADKITGEKQVGGYSLSSGSYVLPVKQGSYYVGIEPLDGDPRGMDPYRINDFIANTRDTAFTTEYFDANESGIEEDPLAAVPVSVTSNASTSPINLVTNAVNFPGVVRRFKPGANYFAYPVTPPSGLRAFELLKALGTADEFNSIDRFNPSLQKFERASFVNGEPQGINFPIRRGEGYLVHAKQEQYVTFKGIADCPKVSLVTGLNLFAVPCPSNGYSSFELLEDLGSKDEVVTLKHLNAGRADEFKETHYAGDEPSGEQFYIANGEAYYAQMAVAKSAVTLPSSRRAFPPVITSISPGRGVPGDLVMIQGEGFDPSVDNNSILFNELPAHIVYTTPTIIAATIPANASSGPIKVTTNGRDSNTLAFTVLPKTIEEKTDAEGGETVTPILPNQAASGTLAELTEQDRYTFMGLENDTATIKARSVAPSNLGLMLALEDPNGVIIASTDAASFEAQLTNILLPTTGRYSLVVFAASEHHSGQYTVSLNVHNDTTIVGQINITQGDGQTTTPGSELPEPIQIYVTGPTGKALVGVPVTFSANDVTFGTSNGYSAANAGSSIIVTDANGVATVNVTVPNAPGIYTITVNVPGLAPRILDLSITNKKVARVVASQQIQDCAGQGCSVGEQLPEPYSLQVLDEDGNGIPNVFVQWLVVTGKGELKQFSPSANSTGRQKTDAEGRVKVFHKLGEKLYSEQAGEATGIPIAQSVVAVVSGKKANTVLFQPKTKANKPSKLESTKADYIRATYGTSEYSAFRIRVLDRFNNPVENAEIHLGGLIPPMDIVPGIDTEPGHGQSQAEQFANFKTNRFGIWAGQLVVGKSMPTFDEFNGTGSAGLSPTYKVTLSEASAGAHTFNIDVDLGPKMAAPPGQPKVIEGLIGQAFTQPFRQKLFRFQRTDTYKDLGNGKDEDDGDWRDEKFDHLATYPVTGVPVEVTSRRLDGLDFTAQSFKSLSVNNSEGAATVASGDDGILSTNITGSDVQGDHFVTAKVKSPISLQL
ncbi:MAG: matrixin family metalloprotease, partial [Sphingobacteriales bacterium]